MPLGTNHTTSTSLANFIPEEWSDEVIAAYKSNLVMANLVTMMNHKGKKGDIVHVPKPVRGSASAKAASTQVTLIQNAEPETTFNIDQHWEYSRLIEDFAEVLANSTYRAFYTDDAGYALAKQVDTHLMGVMEGFQGGTVGAGTWAAAVIGGDGTTLWDPTAAANTGNGTALTDAGIRKMIQTLDDADVDMRDRVIVIPPVERNVLMGIARFTEQSFTGDAGDGNTLRTGIIGDIYGIPVYVSTNCPAITATDTVTQYRVGGIFHKDAIVLIESMMMRSQVQYKQEYLGTLYTTDTIYGKGLRRSEAGVAFVVPA